MIKNFLFIVPRFAKIGEYYNFPYGMGYVVSNMKKNGFNVFTLNLCHHKEPLEYLISEEIKKHNINVVCTGAMSVHWDKIEQVLNTVKTINSDIITIVGGAIITSDIELALENMQIDFGIVGEGEETSIELANALCKNKDIAKIQGIAFKGTANKIIINEPRPSIQDLDSLPFPDYEGLGYGTWLEIDEMFRGGITGLLFDIDDKSRPAEISASRSCPFRCTFCFHPLGNKYRQRSLDNVFNEIEYLKDKYNITSLLILDELFSSDEERIHEFTNRIKKYGLPWSAQWRVDNVNEPILKKLKDSNVLTIGLGVESLSDIVLKSMKKRITKAEIEHAYKLCDKVGVRAGSNIILGDVAETEDTIKESVNWWKQHTEYDINMRFLVAIPDSEIWKYALANGLIVDKMKFIKDGFPTINLTNLDDKKFYKIKDQIDRDNFTEKYLLHGNVISSEETGKYHDNNPIYKFSVECPCCLVVSDYKYTKYSNRPYSILLCKHCYKRLKISTRKAFKETYLTFALSVIYLNLAIIYWLHLRKHKFIKDGMKMARDFTGL